MAEDKKTPPPEPKSRPNRKARPDKDQRKVKPRKDETQVTFTDFASI